MENKFFSYLQNYIGVDVYHIEAFKDLISFRKVKKGEFLLHQGQVCEHIFFVVDGVLRMYSIDDHGKEHILQFATEHWWLADRNSLYQKEPAAYFIDAIEDSYVVTFDQSFIENATSISPEFRAFHEKILQNRIKNLYYRINLLIGASAKNRYFDFLSTYPDLTNRVPQWMIASYLGITPEGLSRVRKDFFLDSKEKK